ncbi:family 20 glycosylhydrolase [Bacteroides salyersiae]|nr:family 20 glycosylhydrolase [Bacteroides salyersiae]
MTSCQEKGNKDQCSLIPQPNELKTNAGHFAFNQSTVFYVSPELDKNSLSIIDSFAQNLNAISGFQTTSQPLEGTEALPKKNIVFKANKDIVPEGYELSIQPDAVIIRASDRSGIFYAIQTLKQLLPTAIYGDQPTSDAQWTLPCMEIKDAPRFGYRGLHIDVARHFFPKEEMKKILDLMALHKQNTLHWHLTDDQGWRIEIKKYPRLTEIGSIRNKTMIRKEWDNYDTTPYGGFYTQEDIKEVVKYAEERCINIIPEVDLPGHMMAALAAYPDLGCTGGPYEVSGQWGVRDDVLCPGKEKTFTFIEDVLTEVMELFPSEYIHIGGDECPKVRWEKCPKCQARIKAEGLKANDKHKAEFFLQSYVTARVEKFLNDHGRKIIGWDEILEGEPAPNATVMSWRGMDGGIEAARLKHPVIMTPNNYVYLDYYPTMNTQDEPLAIGGYNPVEKVYSLEPVPASLNEEERKYIIGAQGNLWTEYILSNEHLEYMLLPRLAALSEVQWTQPENKNWERFLGNLDHILAIYNKMGVNYGKHIYEIAAKYDVPSSDGTVEVTLSTMGDAPIYYTLDGTEPTEKSTRYNKPIKITENCVLQATAIRENVKIRTFKKEFQFNKATGKKVTLATAPTEKYTFAGASILTDGLRGDFNYSTGYRLGFFDEPMDITIDLGESTPISSVKIGVMIRVGEYVFPPTKITVWTATGKNGEFVKQGETSIPLATADIKDGLAEYSCRFKEVEADRVKVLVNTTSCIPDWHGARTEKGHLFVDEVIVE